MFPCCGLELSRDGEINFTEFSLDLIIPSKHLLFEKLSAPIANDAKVGGIATGASIRHEMRILTIIRY